ncbi:hypothetical protein LTR56_005126 [Elasticomyces elasticus]|nr:hypothetical protein LTR56_005126 [Elasticomyces elasticus]KAK3659582.1 hypothetical protein LTR22_008312 [Elasticomyces elasticus]KAK4921284.1 hypothetical protein LTR49_011287 [Elasticomyces elasticus]KAK5759704.1 hypothetical protein LTS12_010221 [Elasticomyces elasticus]
MSSPKWPNGAALVIEQSRESRKTDTRYPAMILALLSDPAEATLDLPPRYTVDEALFKGVDTSDSNKFKPLPLTTALGYPMILSFNDEYGLPVPNIFVHGLSIDADPESPTFGLPMLETKRGALMLVRQDGRHMHKYHVVALLAYVRLQINEVFEATGRVANGKTVDKKEIAERLLTPKAYAAAFEKLKKEAVARGDPGWQGLECPVEVD